MITYDQLISEYIPNAVFSELSDKDLVAGFELAVLRHDDMELSDTQTNCIFMNMNGLRRNVLTRMEKQAT